MCITVYYRVLPAVGSKGFFLFFVAIVMIVTKKCYTTMQVVFMILAMILPRSACDHKRQEPRTPSSEEGCLDGRCHHTARVWSYNCIPCKCHITQHLGCVSNKASMTLQR
jgi:hypothetical protein